MKKIWNWIKKALGVSDKTFLKAAVDITQKVKSFLESGVVSIVTSFTKTPLDDKIVAEGNKYITLLLAEELLIQDAAKATTEEESKAIAKKIIDVFGKLSDEKKEELYTTIAAKIYIFVKQHAHGEKITFGQAAQLVEAAYQVWISSKA